MWIRITEKGTTVVERTVILNLNDPDIQFNSVTKAYYAYIMLLYAVTFLTMQGSVVLINE